MLDETPEVVTTDVACTVCGCVCDDLTISVRGDRIVRAERACNLAEPWFLNQYQHHPAAASVDGQETSFEEAIARSVDILRNAQAPLIYGLSRSSTEGQRASIALAEHLGATIDTTASLCHSPSILALQTVGESTCSLGEIRNRADLVIFWGSDPLVTHPRHMERYSVDPPGRFVPNGRADRFVVVIDSERTRSAERADLFLQVEPDRDFDVLWTLRGLIAGQTVGRHATCGADPEALTSLAERMKGCRCGVVFFGLGLSQRGIGHLNVTALLMLVRDLHRFTRFHARRMRMQGDVTGADSVLCWQTGFPFSVNFAKGFPRYGPGEYSAEDVLRRQETDAVVLVGSETVGQFSPAARAHLESVPTICLDHPSVVSAIEPTVRFTTAVNGIHRDGTAYRMDEVPIPLRAFVESDSPDDSEVLEAIRERLPAEVGRSPASGPRVRQPRTH